MHHQKSSVHIWNEKSQDRQTQDNIQTRSHTTQKHSLQLKLGSIPRQHQYSKFIVDCIEYFQSIERQNFYHVSGVAANNCAGIAHYNTTIHYPKRRKKGGRKGDGNLNVNFSWLQVQSKRQQERPTMKHQQYCQLRYRSENHKVNICKSLNRIHSVCS